MNVSEQIIGLRTLHTYLFHFIYLIYKWKKVGFPHNSLNSKVKSALFLCDSLCDKQFIFYFNSAKMLSD